MSDNSSAPPTGVRLQKVLAAAGVASRRVCEQYIAEGRVSVNGAVVTVPGTRINPHVDRVAVNGSAVQLDTTKRYIMLNKPRGIVSSMRDEQGRPDLSRFTAHMEERLFNVGRLDVETSGLLILTNDGEIAHVLAHPSFGVAKTYVAKVRGAVEPRTLTALKSGITLDDGPISVDAVRVLDAHGSTSTLVELTIHSGRNRIVRRMMAAVGHPVVDLVRRSFGPLHLGTLRSGEMRELSKDELGGILTIARNAHVTGEIASKEYDAGTTATSPRTAPDTKEESR
ncbi:pseudouridine synthase [Paramicrobacterium chengjingii]|uniref:Pseudouridine synthase n=1 Tax=Paramicrobacterium chengjingii TaxID=2769067 RepID=A0ABX6YFB8_9MICO|nr:pseudouridine synthase [Microbacterium chengjingii]QPZ37097.1 rRNA pseudouridine synthase [Microbacterium chengjingii]